MRVSFGLFAAACTALLLADQASAFTANGLPASMRTQAAASAPLKASFNEFEKLPSPQKKTMTRARKEEIIKTKLFGSAILSAALFFGSAFTGMVALTASPEPAFAAESKVVGQLKGSGLVFKDTLSIERFEDPKVCLIHV